MKMVDEIVAIKIIPEGGVSAAAGGGHGGFLGGMSKTLQGALRAVGIASLVGIVAQAVSINKALMSVVGNILKMVGFLLKPITDVVMIFLMPILMVLKPIVMLVNQIMAPFVALAMDAMQEGGQLLAAGDVAGAQEMFASAGGIVLSGLGSVLVSLAGELLDLSISLLLGSVEELSLGILGAIESVVTPVLVALGLSEDDISAAFDNAEAAISGGFDRASEVVSGLIDNGVSLALENLAGVAASIGESVGIETADFLSAATNNINSIFGSKGGITDTFEDNLVQFRNAGVSKIESAVGAFNAAFSKLKSSFDVDLGKDNRGVFGVVADAIAEVSTFGFATTSTFN